MAIIRPYGLDDSTKQPRIYQAGDTLKDISTLSNSLISKFDDFHFMQKYEDASNSRPFLMSEVPYDSNGSLDGAQRDWQISNYTAFTDAIGVVELATSDDLTTGYAAMYTTELVPGLGISADIEFRFKVLDTTTVKLFLGLASSETTHLPNDFLGYTYDSSAGTTTQSVYRLGGTNQATATLTNLNTNWHTFRVVWDDVNNTSTLYLDGSSVQTPTPNFTNPMFPCVRIQKVSGATRRHVYLDWWKTSFSHTVTR